MLRRNTAGQFVYFAGVNATTGAALTGATFSCRRSLDGTFAAATGSITEDTGLGLYKMALSQADTNGNNCGYFFTATNAVPVCLTVIATALDPTSTAFGLSIAKTTNITGFNDIAAPTGFAAATFPAGTIANTTNITAGTITTTTNLTNLPAITANWLTAAGTAADFTTEIQAGLATAAALATAQIDLDNIDAKTTNLPAAPAAVGDIPSAATVATAVLTTAMAESYRADGATGTLAQMQYEMIAHLGESSIVATTKTIKKVDGTTAAATFTLDDATTPTSITRAT